MRYHEIKIETTPDGTEIVAAALLDIGIDAAEIVDGRIPDPGNWDYIDDSLIQPPSDEAYIRVFLEDNDAYPLLLQSLKSMLASLPSGLGSLAIIETLCDDSEWKDVWKTYFKPFKAGAHIVICPLWESYTTLPEDIVVKIDPGAAFGSGLHETTKLCIQNLEQYVTPGSTVFDVGCGSGILAITAAKLGALSVLAADMDDLSVKAARENCLSNQVTSAVALVKSDLLNDVKDKKADVIVANIVADVIIRLNRTVKDYLNLNGIYIMSGIIADRLDDVIASLKACGFNVLKIDQMGEWRAVTASPK